MNKVYLHIDRLVLEGIDSQSQSDYVLGLQQGLQHMLTTGVSVETLKNMGDIRQLSIQSNVFAKNSGAKSQGINTAKHIFNGMQGNSKKLN